MRKLLLCLLALAPVGAYGQQPNTFSLFLSDRGLWRTEASRVNQRELLKIPISRHATFSGQAAVTGNISYGVTILPKLELTLRLFL